MKVIVSTIVFKLTVNLWKLFFRNTKISTTNHKRRKKSHRAVEIIENP